VLLALLERPGELVTRSDLRQKLWNDGTVVDFDNNLNSAVATLRAAFGDSAKFPQMIETLPRQGYRLIADVIFDASHSSRSGGETPVRENTPVEKSAPIDVAAHGGELREEAESRREDSSGTPLSRGRTGLVWLIASMSTVLVVLAAGATIYRGISANRLEESDSLRAPATLVVAPDDPVARRAWQRAVYLEARESTGNRTRAVESLREVLREEPKFAPAHVKIAETLSKMSFEGALDIREGLEQARISAGRARALGDISAASHRIVALADMHLEWDFIAAARKIESALRLDPGDAETYLAAATLLSAVGDMDGAVLAARRAVELDPASLLLKADLGYFLVAAGHHAEALELSREMLKVDPSFVYALTPVLIAAERLGRFEESFVAAQRIMDLRGANQAEIRALGQGEPVEGLTRFRRWDLATVQSTGNGSFFKLALKHAALGEDVETLSHLKRAIERREPWLVYLRGSAQFDSLREDPRFTRLETLLGTPSPNDDVVARIVTQIESLRGAGS
jgi:DNA-binding winged helix-turn-helix (wHTH) protein